MRKSIYVGLILLMGVSFLSFDLSRDQEFEKRNEHIRNPVILDPSDVQWAKSYGLSYGVFTPRALQKTDDDGYAVLCWQTLGSKSGGTWLTKLDSVGKVEWVRSFGGFYNSLLQTTDGGYLVAGRGLIKLNPIGDIEWLWRTSHEEFDSMERTADGGYILGGSTSLSGYYLCVLKLSSTGSIEWKKKFGWNERWCRCYVKQTLDNGYICAGFTPTFGSGANDIFVIKLDANGENEWQKCYGGPDYEATSGIAIAKDGGYILAGVSESYSVGKEVLWILKLFQDGQIEWQKYYSGIGVDETSGSRIIQTSDGGYIVSGTVDAIDSQDNFLIMKLSPIGDIEWQKSFGSGNSREAATHVCQAIDGGFVITGTTSGLGVESANARYPASNFLVVKLSQSGDLSPCFYSLPVDLMGTSTYVSPIPSYFVLEDFDIEFMDNSQTPWIRDLNSVCLCWNLNQPPADISLSSGINRSLFQQELYITLTWSPNPLNSGFSIDEYRIYSKPPGKNEGAYQLLAKVSGQTFKFEDYNSDITKKFLYVI